VAAEDVHVEVEEGHFRQGDEDLVEDLVDVKVLVLLVGVQCREHTSPLVLPEGGACVGKTHHQCHLNMVLPLVLDEILNMVAETPAQNGFVKSVSLFWVNRTGILTSSTESKLDNCICLQSLSKPAYQEVRGSLTRAPTTHQSLAEMRIF
jgi:hypothetical protein